MEKTTGIAYKKGFESVPTTWIALILAPFLEHAPLS